MNITETTAAIVCGIVPLVVLCSPVHVHVHHLYVVLARTVRPYVKVLAVVVAVVYRFVGGSLWRDVVNFVDMTTDYLSQRSSLAAGCWTLLQDGLVLLMLASASRLAYCLLNYSPAEWKDYTINTVFNWSKENIPQVKKEMDKEKQKTKDDLKGHLKKDPNRAIVKTLPKEGRKNVQQEIVQAGKNDNGEWQKGKVSGTVYQDSEQHTNLMNSAYAAFAWSNPLHPGIWPTLNQYEAEIISMTANLLSGGKSGVGGATTSGGTESIILAIRSHLGYYGARRYIQYPELICGPTAHAAVDKACELMSIRKVVVDCDPEGFTLVPKLVERKITANTILIYSSAPNYPQGVIDPISDLSSIALKYDIGLHVDACLGGFVLPFAKQLGHDIPPFDFANDGVTSMSVDTHKYAYASKGTSVVLYRNETLRQEQYFPYSDWTGGLYSTPTIAGSRPGALLACAWAALVSIGEKGYQERVQLLLTASQKIWDGISKMNDVYPMGKQSPTMIVCFSSETLDIYRIGDMMEKKGWSLNALQHPASIHICVTLNTVHHVDTFLSDLQESTQEARKEGALGKTKGTAAIYGTTNKFPAGPVKDLLRVFTDMTLKV